jgi:glycosyltransferase involved in cell wall biosynthesis
MIGAKLNRTVDEPMLVSVIVPIYQSAQYLRKSLESILNQTYSNLDIILVEDGSQDISLAICEEYAVRDNRITIIKQPHAGVVAARKAGLEVAKGEYVVWVDSDDWIDGEMIKQIYQRGMKKDVEVIGFGYNRVYEDRTVYTPEIDFEEGLYKKDEIDNYVIPNLIYTEKFYMQSIFMGLWNHVCKTGLIKDSLSKIQNDFQIGEDFLCCTIFYSKMRNLVILHYYPYYYRQRKGSLVHLTQNVELSSNVPSYRLIKEESNIMTLPIVKKGFLFSLYNNLLTQGYCFTIYTKNSSIFPFENISRGNKIIIWGAGNFGTKLYHYVLSTGICDLVAWTDTRFQELNQNEKQIEDPKMAVERKYDYIVLAILNARMRGNVLTTLLQRGIPRNKISDIDITLLTLDTLEEFLSKSLDKNNY